MTSTSEETAEDWLARSKGARPRTIRPPSSVAMTTASSEARPSCGPVDVFEAHPEGELVERESGADAEEGGEDLVPGTAGFESEAEKAGAEDQHDAPDEVMDVQPALGFDAAGPPGHAGTADQASAGADEEERREERPQHHEPGALARFVEEVPGDFEVQSH